MPHDTPIDTDHATDLVEAYLDEELPAVDRRRLERRLETEPELAAELALARSIREGLGGLRRACPPSVIERVEAHTSRPTLRDRLRAIATGWLPPASAGRPAPWRTAFVAAAMLAAVLTVFPPASQISPPHTDGPAAELGSAPGPQEAGPPPDVEQARRDVELAFAYLGRLGRTAESSVRQLAVDQLTPQKLGNGDAP